jgi:uncharacterized protein (DUF2141 family)
MNRINLVIVMIPFIGLAGAFFSIQSARSLQLIKSDLPQDVAPASQEEEKASSAATGTDQPDLAHPSKLEPYLKLVSSSGSGKSLSVETVPQAVCEQTICVKGLKAKASNIHVAVFDSEVGFPKPELCSQAIVVSVAEDQVSLSLPLPCNQPIAVAVFQDIDGNGSLSKNKFGIPTEPYGFSNDVRGLFGPPSFSQAAFTISHSREGAGIMEINMR